MSPSVRTALRLFAVTLALPFAARSAEDSALPPAIASLRQKAESGNAIAQYNLGLAYAQGRGIPVDLVEGFVWLNLAADSGAKGRELDPLLRELTPDQMSEGLRRLAARPPRPAPRPASAEPAKTEPEPPREQLPASNEGDIANEGAVAAPESPEQAAQLAALSAQLTTLNAEKAAQTSALTTLRRDLSSARFAASQASAPSARLANLTAEAESARAALAQLNTELLAQKDARAQATQEADAARAQLSTVLAASTAAPTSLGEARTNPATGAAVLSAPGLPESDSPPTARLATNRERIAASAKDPAPAETGPRTHLVAPDETLEFIAKKYYGRPERWRLLFAANNAQLSLGRPLKVGMILEIPER